MLTVIRELAEEAEARAAATCRRRAPRALVRRGEDSLARTPRACSTVLREAGVVDAGGAGLVEIVRGLAAAVDRRGAARAPAGRESLGFDAIHQELSRVPLLHRRSSSRATASTREALEGELEQLGDSLLVVGDATALKVHVHTDEPGRGARARRRARRDRGSRDREHARADAASAARACSRPCPDDARQTDGRRGRRGRGEPRLFESLGATSVVDGGQTMNPSTAELVAAIERDWRRAEVVLLPNNANVILSAEQAAELAAKPVQRRPDAVDPGGARRDRRVRPAARLRRRTRPRCARRSRRSRPARSPSPRATRS